MNISRILFLAIFLFSASTLLTVSSILSEVKLALPWDGQGQSLEELAAKQAELRAEYQKQLIALLEDYSTNGGIIQDKQEINIFEERLLSLTVPSQFQDLHFKLAAVFGKIREGSSGTIDDSQLRLRSLIKEYSWLASTLSIFIINNFS